MCLRAERGARIADKTALKMMGEMDPIVGTRLLTYGQLHHTRREQISAHGKQPARSIPRDRLLDHSGHTPDNVLVLTESPSEVRDVTNRLSSDDSIVGNLIHSADISRNNESIIVSVRDSLHARRGLLVRRHVVAKQYKERLITRSKGCAANGMAQAARLTLIAKTHRYAAGPCDSIRIAVLSTRTQIKCPGQRQEQWASWLLFSVWLGSFACI